MLFKKSWLSIFLKLNSVFLLSGVLISCFQQPRQLISPDELKWLQQHEFELEVLFGYEAPPNAFHNENGEYVGLLVDYLHEIEQQLKISFKFKHFDSWNELIEYSKIRHNFIVVGIAPTTDRSKYLSFTPSFIQVPYVIVTRTDYTSDTMQTLINSKVCTVSNYAINDYIQDYFPGIKPAGVSDNLEGLRAVSTGACDAMIINQMYASYLIASQGIANLKIAGESGYSNELSAATSLKDSQLSKLLSKAVQQIDADRKSKLFNKWVTHHSPGIPASTILLITSIIVSLLVLIWLWNISLKRQVKKQTQTILKANEKFELAIRRAPIPMVLTNSNQDIELFNDKFIEVFGYTLKDISTAEQWWEKAYPDASYRKKVQDSWSRAIKVAAENNSEIDIQYWNLTIKDGTSRHVEFKMTPLGDISLIAMNDITARIQAEEELRKLSRAVEFSSSAIVITDMLGIIEYVNPKFSEITKYSKEEAIGKNPKFLKSGETAGSIYVDLWKTITAGKEW